MSGRLIALEGIDASGKSTQVELLAAALKALGRDVKTTKWNSSKLTRKAIRRGKEKRLFRPQTWALIHAADFWDRHERVVVPAIEAGATVIADRWFYTALARDCARGLDAKWVIALYQGARIPDLVFHFAIDSREALARKRKVSFYEAGMDLGLSQDERRGFAMFQARVAAEYDELFAAEQGLNKPPMYRLDARKPIEAIASEILRRVDGMANGAA
jgi:dTMP kinase